MTIGMQQLFQSQCEDGGHTAIDWWVINDYDSSILPTLLKGKKLYDPKRVKVFIDHDAPCGSVEAAIIQKELIRFASEHGCELFSGRGISHLIMLEQFVDKGHVVATAAPFPAIYGAAGAFGVSLSPEQLADSICSGNVAIPKIEKIVIQLSGVLRSPASAKDFVLWLRFQSSNLLKDKYVVFIGSGLDSLTRADCITICQLLGAAGAVFDKTSNETPNMFISLEEVPVCVSEPSDLTALKKIEALGNITVNEVFIGGCSGGKLDDLRVAAGVLKGKHINTKVRLIVAPATASIYNQAADEGLLDIFLDAGAILMNQGCSVCYGKSQGVLDDGEILLSAGTNYIECAGYTNAQVYLCSPMVAAASALYGRICKPMEVSVYG